MRRRLYGIAGVAAVLGVAALMVILLGWASARANEGFRVGVIDSDRILSEYLSEELRIPLTQATEELQAEFDRESEGLSDQEKQALFREYQSRLDAIRDALIQEQIPRIQSAISAVAQEQGITLVLDQTAVHLGGVDLTEKVLARLGVRVSNP